MVPLDRALATFYSLSIVTKSPSAAVWPQFSMESFKLVASWKRWEIGPRLLLITNRKLQGLSYTMEIIDLRWPWRSVQYCNRNCIGCIAYSLATAGLSCFCFLHFCLLYFVYDFWGALWRRKNRAGEGRQPINSCLNEKVYCIVLKFNGTIYWFLHWCNRFDFLVVLELIHSNFKQ